MSAGQAAASEDPPATAPDDDPPCGAFGRRGLLQCLASCQVVAALFFVATLWESRIDAWRLLAIQVLFANAVGLAGFGAGAVVARLTRGWPPRRCLPVLAAAAAAGGLGGLLAARGVAERIAGGRIGWSGADLALVVLLVGGYLFYAAAERRAREARRRQELAELEGLRARAESELRALQSTIEPHFIFNALNSIAAVVGEDPARAERALVRLSRLLRAVVEASRQPLIPLERELELVRHYLEIERVRFEDRLRFRIEVDPALADTQVPALVLQPLVENAVKHGVSLKSEPGLVEVVCRAASEDAVLEVWDDGDGRGEPGAGVGLETVRKRLVAGCGDGSDLVLERVAGRTLARVTLPRHGGAAA